MKKNTFYSLQTLSGTDYLLPFGQAVAAHRPGLRLGGCGVQLWALLDRYDDPGELERAFLAGLDESERAEAGHDLARFISELEGLGLLEQDAPAVSAAAAEEAYADLSVGPLRIRLRGGAERFHEDFAPFLAPADPAAAVQQTVAVTLAHPPSPAGLRCLLSNGELEVFADGERLLLRFPPMPGIASALLTPEGTCAVFYVRAGADAERLRADLFHAIRHAVLFRAQRCGFYAMHAVSLLYRDRVWLLSAPAGTGKSTHARLWQERFGVPILNGDLALLSMEGNAAVFHPMPWCGTSGIARRETHPLGGVVFLKRGTDNRARPLPSGERQLRCANRLISPVWTERQLQENLAFSALLASHAPMWELRCNMEPEAAAVLKDSIDRRLEEEAHG